MYRFDYHLHTRHSMDSEMPLDVLCETAIQVGLNEICITDHTEFGHPGNNADVPPVPEDWLADIERAKQKYPELVIRKGIEIGDNPACREQIKTWHDAMPLDFRLLSLHMVDGEDPYDQVLFEHTTQDAFYRRYAECRLESILAWGIDEFDSIAHLGYCAKFAPYPVEVRPFRHHHAPDQLDALFSHLAQNGKAMEINTSGHKTFGECIPDRELITRFMELGGEFVTVGSDAHVPQYVGSWLDDARELAKSCGIRYGVTFDKRVPTPVLL